MSTAQWFSLGRFSVRSGRWYFNELIFIVEFCVAQAFTPGSAAGATIEAPLMGLLKTNPLSFPGVNAWATQKSFQIAALPLFLGVSHASEAYVRLGHF